MCIRDRFKNTRGLERDPPSVREVFVRGCWDEREVAPLLRAVRRYDFDAHEAMVLRMQAALGPSPDWTTILRANREARAARQSGELLRALEAEGVAAREVLRAERERCFRVLTERQRAARIEGAETPPRGGPERRKSPGPGGST